MTACSAAMEPPGTTLGDESKEPQKARGLRRLWNAFGYSVAGVVAAFQLEAAFRQELIAFAVLAPVAVLLPFDPVGTAIVIASMFGVLVVELLNSALEWVVDYVSLEKHPFAKRAKDMASAAVFLSLLNCGAMWALVIAAHWSDLTALLA